MRFDIKTILKDMQVAIQKKDIDILNTQLFMIFLYLETLGYEATKYFPMYISIKDNISDEIREIIDKYKKNKKAIVLKNGTKIFYSSDISEILVEECKNKRKVCSWLLINIKDLK
ncbi:MAG: hypothetical protein QXI77_02125 [Nanopusillaceae archaeon]